MILSIVASLGISLIFCAISIFISKQMQKDGDYIKVNRFIIFSITITIVFAAIFVTFVPVAESRSPTAYRLAATCAGGWCCLSLVSMVILLLAWQIGGNSLLIRKIVLQKS